MKKNRYKFTIENAKSECEVRNLVKLAWDVYKKQIIPESDIVEKFPEKPTKNYDYIIDKSNSLQEASNIAAAVWYREIRRVINSIDELVEVFEGEKETYEREDDRSFAFKTLSGKFYDELKEKIPDGAFINTPKGIIRILFDEKEWGWDKVQVDKIRLYEMNEF